MAKRFAAIQVESATWSGGDKLDYWVKERQQWWGAYAVLTAVRGGSELLIFVLRAGGKTRPESNRRALQARIQIQRLVAASIEGPDEIDGHFK